MNYYVIIGAVVVVAIIVAIVINHEKKKRYQEILIAIQNKDHKTFNKLLESKSTKFLYPAMYLDSLRLNEAMLRDNKEDVDKVLTRLTKNKLKPKDKESVYAQAYNYYLSLKDNEKTKEWYLKIQELDNDRLKKEISRTYDIYVEKGYKYLDEMLNEVENMDPTNAGVNEFLISLMYQNKGDKENAKKYRQLSEKHIKQLDEETANKLKKKEKK